MNNSKPLSVRIRHYLRLNPGIKTGIAAEELGCDPRYVTSIRSRMKHVGSLRQTTNHLEQIVLGDYAFQEDIEAQMIELSEFFVVPTGTREYR